jgi:hypothetical protein
LDGEPLLRLALLDPERLPVIHMRVDGVPDDVLEEYWEERYEELELDELVAQYGGTVREIPSRATALAMTRAREGGYRVSEVDAGAATGFNQRYDTLDDALRMAALGYGHPPGILTWKEMPANK